jgi:IS30 family transposase
VASRENKHIKLTTEVIEYIREKLKEYWCTEQIVGCLELDKKIKISTETAYRFVLQITACAVLLVTGSAR